MSQISTAAQAARERYRGPGGRFGAQPANESQARIDNATPLPPGVHPDPTTKGLRDNKRAYRLDSPVTWTEPEYTREEDAPPPQTEDFDRVVVSYSVVDAEVVVMGVVKDRPSYEHIIWDGVAQDDGDALAQMYDAQDQHHTSRTSLTPPCAQDVRVAP